jgi:transcriptional regulator with XRE-family HTH domain
MGKRRDEHKPRRRGRPSKQLDAEASSAARLGVELRRRREQCGLTQVALAALVGFSPQHLSEVERGVGSVSEQFIQACDDALQADGRLVKLLTPVVYERARARWSNRAERHSTATDASEPCGPSLASESGITPSRGVCPTDAEVIAEMISALRRVDNRYGGGYARGVVLRYFNGEVRPLLRTMQAQGGAPRRLMQVAAELTQLAGWISHDVGENNLARWYFGESLRLARAAGDQAFASEVLAGMSHQAGYLRDGPTAVDAAQAAHRHATRSRVPLLVSEAAAMEAHGHALCGDARACLVAMRSAERALETARDDRRPPWLEYFDHAYLAAKYAHTLRALGESKAAERFAVRSLRMSDGYERGRLFNTVLLARIHADRDEVDEACELGRRSVLMASGIRSARGRGYLNGLGRQLERHAAVPEVRALREQIHALGPPATWA